MPSFIIEGGHRLKGEIIPQGAKNEALQVLCATLLTSQPVRIKNLPDIADVNNQIRLLQDIGVSVSRNAAGDCTFQADKVDTDILHTGKFLQCCGRRRLDTHFLGLQKLGGKFEYDAGRGVFTITTDGLKGCYMLLDEASVTGTANIVMAAVLAEGTTTIYNAACEPYIQQLCRMLNRMGARISGIGSNLLTIQGVKELGGAEHTVLPDMIEVGSFIGMAAMVGDGVLIRGVAYDELGIIPDTFRRLGIEVQRRGDDIYVPRHERYQIESFLDGSFMTIADAPWPGLTPDLLSVLLVVSTQAKGSVLIHQKMFESRLFFVDKLIDMGAQIILCDPHRAVVVGHNHKLPLHARRMTSPDIRAGIALLIAAMSAEGTSRIENIGQIDRGYQHIEERLNALGANIKRVE